MNRLKVTLLLLLFGLSYLNPTQAANFVCSQDLDGNGDVLGVGEYDSCAQVGSEQFCSIGAINCNSNQSFTCGITHSKFNTRDLCIASCQIPPLESNDEVWTRGANSWDTTHQGQSILLIRNNGWWSHWFDGDQTVFNGVLYKKGAMIQGFGSNNEGTARYKVEIVSTQDSVCTAPQDVIFSCPVAGNSCINNAGVQQCSPNKCIDLDDSNTIITTPPELSPLNIDNGNRNESGVCTDTVLLFDGKGMRCRYKGWFGLADNCCKSSGKVLQDSTGDYATSLTTKVAMSATWDVLSAGYTGFTEAYAFFGDMEMASAGAEVAAQGALESFSLDPTTIAISLAIKVFMDMMGCEQAEQEAAIYKDSGYCHEVGSFCSKKVFLLGCMEKSKGMCCFNSKLARIMQQQGREQLGLGWGSAENPSCGGFSPSQFQALDFSRIDMSEYYGDIKSQGESLIQDGITKSVEDYYKKISP